VVFLQDWSSKHNAAFSYYAYHIYANLYTLNKLRESRGLNTFSFRWGALGCALTQCTQTGAVCNLKNSLDYQKQTYHMHWHAMH
jgi:hypothetical protein